MVWLGSVVERLRDALPTARIKPLAACSTVAQQSARTSVELNTKIRNLCLILSILVVFNHSSTYNPLIGSDGHPMVSLVGPEPGASLIEVGVQFFLSGSLWRVANPIFFMVSGYFFFFGWQPSLGGLGQKLGKRIFTLLAPFLIWTVLTMSINFLVYCTVSVPAFKSDWDAGRITASQLVTFFLNMPTSSQLWFLRDLLLVLVFVVPVLALFLPRLGWTAVALFVGYYLSGLPGPGIHRATLAFFGVGAALGYLCVQPRYPSALPRRLAVIVWAGVAAGYFILALFTDWNLKSMMNIVVITGIFGIWAFYDLLPGRVCEWLTRLSPYRFFIYMAFDPILPILQRVVGQWVPPTPAFNLLSYFLYPAVVVALCVGLGMSLRHRLPRGYLMLTGGR